MSLTILGAPTGVSISVSPAMHFPTLFAANMQRSGLVFPRRKNSRCLG